MAEPRIPPRGNLREEGGAVRRSAASLILMAFLPESTCMQVMAEVYSQSSGDLLHCPQGSIALDRKCQRRTGKMGIGMIKFNCWWCRERSNGCLTAVEMNVMNNS